MSQEKPAKVSTFDEGVIFGQMADSAFDFLDQAAADLEKKPKYAVIHFATAIELILKARLLREHWALVVTTSGEADRHAFQGGSAKTVTVDQAIKRLEQIADQHLPAGAPEAFKAISTHRNRMIHFFHEATSREAEETARAKVTAELLLGWYYLLRMFRTWEAYFVEYQPRIQRVEWGMRRLRGYLQVVFDKLQPQLVELAAKGVTFHDCASCGFLSARVASIDDMIDDLSCGVCGLTDTLVTMPCPQEDCQGTLRLTGYNNADEACDTCNQQIEREHLVEFLDTEHSEYFEFTVKNCGLCTSPGSVVQHNKIYICTNCLTHDEQIPTCEWCNEMQLGYDLDFSYYKGCEFCDGKGGWDAD